MSNRKVAYCPVKEVVFSWAMLPAMGNRYDIVHSHEAPAEGFAIFACDPLAKQTTGKCDHDSHLCS